MRQHLTNRSASSPLSDLDDPTKGIWSIMSQATAVSSSRPVQSFMPTQRPGFQQRSQSVQPLEAAPSYSWIMPPPIAFIQYNNVSEPTQNNFHGRPQSPNLNPNQNLPLPPRSSSSHPVINGTEQFDRPAVLQMQNVQSRRQKLYTSSFVLLGTVIFKATSIWWGCRVLLRAYFSERNC